MNDFGQRFLATPDLFPARIAGEAWGDEAIAIDLPGGPYRFTGLTAEQRDGLASRYGARAGRSEGAACEIAVHRAPADDFLPIDTRGWEYSLDFIWNENAIAIAGMSLMARIDLARSRAAIWTPVAGAEPFWGVAENVLRPLVAVRLLATGGLLVHSAAVAVGGAGLLFAGPSGSGKSTLSAMALGAGHPVLSDDLNAIVPDGDRFAIVPLPFTGDLAESDLARQPFPLRAVVSLRKGEEESLAPMAMADAVSLVVRSASFVNGDEHRADLLLDRAGEIAGSARRAVLTFRREGDVWPILGAL